MGDADDTEASGDGNDATTTGDRIGVSLRSGSFLPPAEPPTRTGVVGAPAGVGVDDADLSGSSGTNDGDMDGSGDEDEDASGAARGMVLLAGVLPALADVTSDEKSSGDAEEDEEDKVGKDETAGGVDDCMRAWCMAATRIACSLSSSR